MDTRIEQLKEYARIIKDTPYALKTYLQTYDNTQKKYVPLDLFPDQIQLLNDYEKYNENITRKYRQAGVTTVTAAWISKKLQVAKPENPEKVLIVANKRDTAIEMANKIRNFLDQWPIWINVGFSPDKNSESRFKLNNGCEVKSVATSADALRGYTPTILIFDEAAYIEAGDNFWAASMASLSCIHEDSYILTDKGLYQLKDIVKEKENIGITKYDGNLKVINKDLITTDIKSTFKSVKSKCFKIVTKGGSELIGSYKHPIIVNNDHEDEWVKLEEVKTGDKIKFQYNQNQFGDDIEINFDLRHFNEKEKIILPKKLNENLDLAYLIGLYVAEGSSSKNMIQICNGDIEIENFLLNFGFIKNRKYHFYYCSSYLQRFLMEFIGMENTIARNKKIPNLILRSSKETIVAFLQGMFDGDGCAFKTGVKYSSTSKILVSQLQILLLNFGIKSYIKYREEKTSKTSILSNKQHITKIYNLYIKNEDILSFFDKIGFRLKRKQDKSNFFIDKIKNKSFIYATKKELKEILSENGIRRKDYEKEFRFLDLLMRKDKSHISLNAYDKIIEKNLSVKTTLNKWIERYEKSKYYFYDEIIKIDSFDDETYDLEVPDGHSFISNGIISHNTGGKIILISTPCGFDEIYYGIYNGSVRGENNFHITELKWHRDPRYSKDLKWVKVTDIVHYMLNRDQYNDEELCLYDVDPNTYDDLINQGYKPYSPWFEGMSKKFKYDKRKIAQEIDADFLGSGDGIVSPEIVNSIIKNMVREPVEKYMMGQFWAWKDPIPGHRYIMGCLPPGEKVLTDDGLLSIENVDDNHKLVDEKGNYTPIINKQVYDVVDENIYEIGVDNTFRTTKFTKEHPILTSSPILKRNWKRHDPNIEFKKRFWDFDFIYKKVDEISIGDWLKIPNIYKRDLDFKIDEKWINGGDVRKDFLIDSPLSNKDFWWFIGLWLGDGWIGKNKYSHSITICFNKKEYYYLEKCKEAIKYLLDRSPSVVEREKTFDLTFNSKELYNFILENFGQYSYGKKISEWVKFIPNEFKKEIIKGYFDSDGCWLKTIKNEKINSKISFVSVNLELLEGIQDILFSLGIISNLNKLRNASEHDICGKLCKTRIAYNLNLANFDSLQLIELIYDEDDVKLNKFDVKEFSNINKRIISSCHFDESKDFIYFRVKKINKTKYTGNVYNFETESHNFMCHHMTTHNCDVSRGDSEDYSSINIIDFDDMEQVVEYVGKIPPDDLAAIAYKWGIIYKAFIIIDITGGMGVATSRKLQEMGYRDLFIDGINTKNVWEYDAKLMDKIPGINFNNKRTQIIASLEEHLRHGFLVRSIRFVNELNTFVYINGRPDHMKGAHDDSIMSMSIALYAGDICFGQLQRADAQNKSMMESWTLSERTYEPNKSIYSYGRAFDPLGAMNTDGKTPIENPLFQNDDVKRRQNQYRDYAWLFGKLTR